MERLGVVSGHEGSKPRTVLIGEADLPRILMRPRSPDGTPGEEVGAEPQEQLALDE